MRKPKVKKPTVKSVTETFLKYKEVAQKFMYELQHPSTRLILSIDATDKEGKINGVTVVELIAITNTLSGSGEKLLLVPQGKSITGYAVKDPPQAPWELL